jgi:hypothetical protein
MTPFWELLNQFNLLPSFHTWAVLCCFVSQTHELPALPAVAFQVSLEPIIISPSWLLGQILVGTWGQPAACSLPKEDKKGAVARLLRMTTFQGFSCAINHNSSTTNRSHTSADGTRRPQPARNLSSTSSVPPRPSNVVPAWKLKHSAEHRVSALSRDEAGSRSRGGRHSPSDPAAWCDGEARGNADLDACAGLPMTVAI